MATQLAERTADPVTIFRQTISRPEFREQLKMALPSHIPVARFERVATTAVQNNPTLLDPQRVDRRSLFGALVKAAQDGLLPDGREGVIVPYKGKAQWQPMVAGIMTKVRRSGEIANWEVAAVYEKDEFERLLGDDQRIYHKPFEDGDPGEVIGAYSIVTFKDGYKTRDYMPRWRIEKARTQSAMKDSLMWTKFYDEGAIKTVIRHHAKRLPMSTDIEAIFERDETMQHARTPRLESVEEAQAQPVTRLDALEHQIGGGEEPVVQEEIEEQAEELEAEIETEADATADDPHPGTAIADAIIAEINDPMNNAVMDVARVLTKHELDIAAMLDADAVRVEVAADQRRNAIRKEQDAAKAKEGVG